MSAAPVAWPDGRRFAFTVFDDTDGARLDNVGEVYALLRDLGMRVTKSAWPLPGRTPTRASSVADPEYREWLLELQRAGFEIGWHNAAHETSTREETIRGFEVFARTFGHYPRVMANHKDCEENLYWGDRRVSGPRRWAYNLASRFRNHRRFRGHEEGELFWGDLCLRHVQYVRNFDFPGCNTLRACPWMPYHDPRRPWVRYWYASADGHDVLAFNRCLRESEQERLEEEGGLCVMYTHFAKGFQEGGRLQPDFRRLMERLARRPGWFAPVGAVLDHLLEAKGPHELTDRERRTLEWRWLLFKLRTGTR